MKVSVIGASGYAGVELVRILAAHPQVEISHITSESNTGEYLSRLYPHLLQYIALGFESMQDLQKIAEESEIIFLALPQGHAMKIVRQLAGTKVRIVDLGADYRFKDNAVFEQWYKIKHEDPETKAVYGLTEFYREEVKQAKLVDNPGCYTTAAILALGPLLRRGLISTEGIVVDAKSGTTGAGRALKADSLFCSVNENFRAYGLTNHRHTPEIEQEYGALAGKPVVIQFTPHLLPVDRGILATCYAAWAGEQVTAEEVAEAFRTDYGNEYFFRLLGQDQSPQIKNVRGSNYVDFGWSVDQRTRRVIVLAALDNLVKGAAGQAVQNMNVMCGLAETTGLEQLPLYP